MTESKRSKIEPVHVEEAARLKALFTERSKGMSQAEFGATYEIGSQGMVWQYLNAKSPLNLSAALKFARGLDCRVLDFSERLAVDLINDRQDQSLPGVMRFEVGKAGSLSPLSDTPKTYTEAKSGAREINLSEHPGLTEVPRVKFKLSAGVSGFIIEHEEGNGVPYFVESAWVKKNGYDPSQLFACYVTGSSMEPTMWEGDLIIINTGDTKPTDGESFAINYEGELAVKRMRRDAGQWFATSDNPDQRRYSPKRCTPDVKIIGRVVRRVSDRN